MIPPDFIETLLSRVDIVDVIDRFVPLKKAGANYVACCPFHSEKTPSFSVSPTKQFYHCFGCGAHGTAIGFLMEHAGKSFPDAVEELARDAGLEVPRVERPGERERREEAQDLNELLLTAAKFYRSRLKESPQAIEYLKSRGLTGAVAAHFGIGYAPEGWQSLAEVFPRYDDPALEAAGLVIAGDGGKRYDRFRDRVMFPIHDSRGRVIGFGGRVLGAGEPKYLNSPETPVFSKGRELYGLYLARNALRNAGRVVVVEGYMDVVALAQHGIEYAVATLGTSTTPVHAQKLFRLTDSVVFCFDGDNAGRKAAWRALENTLPEIADGKNATFLFLPDGEDPDDFVRKRGKAAFEAALADAVPLSEFLLAELAVRHPPNTPEGKAALVAAARPLFAQIGAPVLSAILRRRLAELAGLPEADLGALLAVDPARGAPAPERPARPAMPPAAQRSAAPRQRVRRPPPSLAERMLLGLLLMPRLAHEVEFPRPDDPDPASAALGAVTALCADAQAPLTTQAVREAFAGTPHAAVIEAILAAGEDQRLDEAAVEVEARAAVNQWWHAERRKGKPAPAPTEGLSVEEDRRLRAISFTSGRAPDGGPEALPRAPDTPPGEGEVRDII